MWNPVFIIARAFKHIRYLAKTEANVANRIARCNEIKGWVGSERTCHTEIVDNKIFFPLKATSMSLIHPITNEAFIPQIASTSNGPNRTISSSCLAALSSLKAFLEQRAFHHRFPIMHCIGILITCNYTLSTSGE